MNSFWVDMALSILFAVLRDKGLLERYQKAFVKLYRTIGMAYGWTDMSDGVQGNELPLKFPPK